MCRGGHDLTRLDQCVKTTNELVILDIIPRSLAERPPKRNQLAPRADIDSPANHGEFSPRFDIAIAVGKDTDMTGGGRVIGLSTAGDDEPRD